MKFHVFTGCCWNHPISLFYRVVWGSVSLHRFPISQLQTIVNEFCRWWRGRYLELNESSHWKFWLFFMERIIVQDRKVVVRLVGRISWTALGSGNRSLGYDWSGDCKAMWLLRWGGEQESYEGFFLVGRYINSLFIFLHSIFCQDRAWRPGFCL